MLAHYAMTRRIEDLGTLLQEGIKNSDSLETVEVTFPNYMQYISSIYVLDKLCALCHQSMAAYDVRDGKAKLKLAASHVLLNNKFEESKIEVSFDSESNMRLDTSDVDMVKEKLLVSLWSTGNELPNCYKLLSNISVNYDKICIDLAGSKDYFNAKVLSGYLKDIYKYMTYLFTLFDKVVLDMSTNLTTIKGK